MSDRWLSAGERGKREPVPVLVIVVTLHSAGLKRTSHRVHTLVPGACGVKFYGTSDFPEKLRTCKWDIILNDPGGTLNVITRVLTRGGQREIGHTQQERRRCDHRGRDWKGGHQPWNADRHRKLEEAGEILRSLQRARGPGVRWMLDCHLHTGVSGGLWPPR